MKYFLDTADQDEIDKWKNHIVGVTSNPILLDRANRSEVDFYDTNEDLFENVFIQIRNINNHVRSNSGNIVYKIPMIRTNGFDGYHMLRTLTRAGIRTCATIVYTFQQFDYACNLGAEFSIVLHHKNENYGFVYRCVDLKERMGYETKIIAASFRRPEQVNECIHTGVDFCTVPALLMEDLFAHDKTLEDYNQFYGE